MAACDQSGVVWRRRHDSESSHSLDGPEWPLCANAGRPSSPASIPEADVTNGASFSREGWFCDGLLCGGETKIRTFTWWLDLAGR